MDLNVKLQRLKHNFGKVQGCFFKILRFQQFLGFKGTIFLKTIP
jgi:hypothetical protein